MNARNSMFFSKPIDLYLQPCLFLTCFLSLLLPSTTCLNQQRMPKLIQPKLFSHQQNPVKIIFKNCHDCILHDYMEGNLRFHSPASQADLLRKGTGNLTYMSH